MKRLVMALLLVLAVGALAFLVDWRGAERAGFVADLEHLAPAARLEFLDHLHQGLELARRGALPRARDAFDRCLEQAPRHAEASFHRARLLLATTAAAAGVELLEDLAREEGPEPRARVVLLELLRGGGPLADQARAAQLEAALAEETRALLAFDREVREWLAEEAPPSPCSALVHQPGRYGRPPVPSPLGRLAHAYARRPDIKVPPTSFGRDRARARDADRECERILAENPGLAGIAAEQGRWLLLSQVRFDLEEGAADGRPPRNSAIVLDLARRWFERSLDAAIPDSAIWHYGLLGLGHVARDMGDFQDAALLYAALLERPGLAPRLRFEAEFNRGVVLYRSLGQDAAKAPLQRAAAGPRTPLLAWLLHLTGVEPLPLRGEEVTGEHRRTLAFEDRAPALGVDKTDGAGPSAWADVDLDGDLDLFASGCDTWSILYRNDGDRFTDVSREAGLLDVASGFSATFADYDNDGDPDLSIGRNGWGGPAPNSLYRNRGDGTFEDVTAGAGVGHEGSSFVHGWADFDRDGFLDLYVANGITQDGSTNTLYLNNGDGTFRDATRERGLAEPPGTATIGFAIGDYDKDGWPDLFVNSWETRNRLYRNQGDGTFEEVAARAGVDGAEHPNSGYVAFLDDFDGDAWPDILLTKLAPFPAVIAAMVEGYEPSRRVTDYATKLYRNRGDGTFEDVSLAAGLLHPHGTMGANVMDVDNDGDLDLYLGTGDPMVARLEPNAFYANEGGRFVDLTRFTGLGHVGKGHGITSADFDQDGDLDLYTPQGGFVHGDLWPNAFYVNLNGNRNHWLAVALEGTQSNRMAVGAKLLLRSQDLVIYREVKAGGAFGSSSTPFVHFGLGSRTAADSLEIAWPSGATSRFTALPADRTIRVVESSPTYTELQPRRSGG